MLFYVFATVPICLSLIIIAQRDLTFQRNACIFIVGFLTLFAALRGYVGIDTYAYHTIFKDAMFDDIIDVFRKNEPFFALHMIIFGTITKNSFAFIASISCLQGYLLYKIINKIEQPSMFLLIYTAVFYFNFAFNTLRVGTAVLFFLYAVYQAEKRNGVKSYAGMLAAILTHYSTIILLLPAILIRYRRQERSRLAQLAIISVVICGFYFIINTDYMSEKIVLYFAFSSAGEHLSSPIGIAFRLLLYFILYLTLVSMENVKKLTLLYLIWMVLRVATIQFMFVDRVEILVNVILLFSAINYFLVGWRRQVSRLAIIGICAINLYSNLNGLRGGDKMTGRGFEMDENHQMSPYLPYYFFWEKRQ